jgi:hypothetical protein
MAEQRSRIALELESRSFNDAQRIAATVIEQK